MSDLEKRLQRYGHAPTIKVDLESSGARDVLDIVDHSKSHGYTGTNDYYQANANERAVVESVVRDANTGEVIRSDTREERRRDSISHAVAFGNPGNSASSSVLDISLANSAQQQSLTSDILERNRRLLGDFLTSSSEDDSDDGDDATPQSRPPPSSARPSAPPTADVAAEITWDSPPPVVSRAPTASSVAASAPTVVPLAYDPTAPADTDGNGNDRFRVAAQQQAEADRMLANARNVTEDLLGRDPDSESNGDDGDGGSVRRFGEAGAYDDDDGSYSASESGVGSRYDIPGQASAQHRVVSAMSAAGWDGREGHPFSDTSSQSGMPTGRRGGDGMVRHSEPAGSESDSGSGSEARGRSGRGGRIGDGLERVPAGDVDDLDWNTTDPYGYARPSADVASPVASPYPAAAPHSPEERTQGVRQDPDRAGRPKKRRRRKRLVRRDPTGVDASDHQVDTAPARKPRSTASPHQNPPLDDRQSARLQGRRSQAGSPSARTEAVGDDPRAARVSARVAGDDYALGPEEADAVLEVSLYPDEIHDRVNGLEEALGRALDDAAALREAIALDEERRARQAAVDAAAAAAARGTERSPSGSGGRQSGRRGGDALGASGSSAGGREVDKLTASNRNLTMTVTVLKEKLAAAAAANAELKKANGRLRSQKSSLGDRQMIIELEREVKKLKAHVKPVQTALDAERQKSTRLEAELEAVKRNNASLASTAVNLEGDNKKLLEYVDTLRAKYRQKSDDLKAAERELGRLEGDATEMRDRLVELEDSHRLISHTAALEQTSPYQRTDPGSRGRSVSPSRTATRPASSGVRSGSSGGGGGGGGGVAGVAADDLDRSRTSAGAPYDPERVARHRRTARQLANGDVGAAAVDASVGSRTLNREMGVSLTALDTSTGKMVANPPRSGRSSSRHRRERPPLERSSSARSAMSPVEVARAHDVVYDDPRSGSSDPDLGAASPEGMAPARTAMASRSSASRGHAAAAPSAGVDDDWFTGDEVHDGDTRSAQPRGKKSAAYKARVLENLASGGGQ